MTDALRIMDLPMAEQVIEVPKISCAPCPSRSLIPEPQEAEQLLEVPTVLSPFRIAEQIVGIPVPRGRGQRRVQGILPRQSSTATHSSVDRISERIVEQIVDISPGGGLGQMRILLVFSHFSPWKKVRSTGQVGAQGHVGVRTLQCLVVCATASGCRAAQRWRIGRYSTAIVWVRIRRCALGEYKYNFQYHDYYYYLHQPRRVSNCLCVWVFVCLFGSLVLPLQLGACIVGYG